MARKKKPEKEPNLERWLVSYADFITLLFAVFVTLYSMGQTDKKKVDQLIISLRESFNYSRPGSTPRPALVDTGDVRVVPSLHPETIAPQEEKRGAKVHAESKDFQRIKSSMDWYLAKHGGHDKVSVEITRRGLVVSLKEAGFFDSGSAIVRRDSLQLLAKVSESLRDYKNAIRVEGHTDNVPINIPPFHTNWELSTARATNVVRYMIDRYGFEPKRLSAIGYGEFRPIVDNGTSEGRTKNRRVDLVLMSRENEKGEP